MERCGEFEEANRSDLEIKCGKPSDATERKLCCEPVVKLEDGGVASSTPEKASERLAGKNKVEEVIELPERYKSIVELFRQMSCSLRLLAFCKKSATFRNVCPQVEILAKRKFSYKHLGQIKYILPEAVQIQKIIIHDEESQCMKPDLKITLVFDVVKDHKQKSDFIALCRLFFSRVVDFSCTHPEGSDIPAATLPQPFSEDNETASSEVLFPDTSVGLNSSAVGIEPTKQVSVENATDQILNSLHTPLKVIYSSVGSSSACDSPLLNHSSEAANLMVDTPAQLPPKRASIETVESHLETSNIAVTFSEKPAKRSLDFSFETAESYVLANTKERTDDFTTSQHDIPHSAKSKEPMTVRNFISNEEDAEGVNIRMAPCPPNFENTKMRPACHFLLRDSNNLCSPHASSMEAERHIEIVHHIKELANKYFSCEYNNVNLTVSADNEGWVSILHVAGIEEIKNATHDIWVITEALRSCKILEIKDDKVRKRRVPVQSGWGRVVEITPQQKLIILIDYYFSEENLEKDMWLVNEMDQEGWISILLIAEFEEVKRITKDINEIITAAFSCENVELKELKIRKKDDWYRFTKKVKKKWTLFGRSKSKTSPSHSM